MLIGEKIKIRAICKADLETLHKIYREPDMINKFEAKADVSLALLEKKLEVLHEAKDSKGEWLIIEDNESNVIGSISYEKSWHSGFSIFNLYIAKEKQGMGFAADAVKRLVKFMMEEKAANRVEVNLRDDCVEAVRVFEKAGFSLEGKRRKCSYHKGSYLDEVVMSILSREYFAS